MFANDAIMAGVRNVADPVTTDIVYDSAGRAASVTAAQPRPADARPSHSYTYGLAPTAGSGATAASQVSVAGLAPASGYARRVEYDDRLRTVRDADATAKASVTRWDPAKDLTRSSTDPAGRTTTTIHDTGDRPTDTWGPAPIGDYQSPTDPQAPLAGRANYVAHTSTAYDENITGLAATWWQTKTLTGAAKVHTTTAVPAATAPAVSPPAGINASQHWSVRYQGEVNLESGGTYTFKVDRTDRTGARLYLGDQTRIDLYADPLSPPAAAATAYSVHAVIPDWTCTTRTVATH